MSWTLREGVSLHPMPFGGAFVMDDARLAVRQISSELAALLAGTATASAGPDGTATSPSDPVASRTAAAGPSGVPTRWAAAGASVTGSDRPGGPHAGPGRADGAATRPAGAGASTTGPDRTGGPVTGPPEMSPALAAELRLGAEEGWLIHQEETA